MARLEVVGGGRMGEALIAGILADGWCEPGELRVVESSRSRRAELVDAFPGVEVAERSGTADAAVLAVKPGDVPAAGAALQVTASGRVLSIAAGVTIAQLEAAVPDGLAVIRAMPNTPALVGSAASAMAGGTSADEDDMAWAEEVLSAVGIVVRVREEALDAVTGVSGSGPAYLFLVAEALVDAGVREGLGRDLSTALVNQTLLGAARLLVDSPDDASALRGAVTSPAGTTAAALHELERNGVRAAFADAVRAATARSRELGGT